MIFAWLCRFKLIYVKSLLFNDFREICFGNDGAEVKWSISMIESHIIAYMDYDNCIQ